MNVKIYQIDMDTDPRDVMFRDYSRTIASGGIDPANYAKTFDGDLTVDNLDAIYETFNLSALVPKGYNGRSLSVSDVVVTPDGAFFVDRVGFKKVDFDEQLTHHFERRW